MKKTYVHFESPNGLWVGISILENEREIVQKGYATIRAAASDNWETQIHSDDGIKWEDNVTHVPLHRIWYMANLLNEEDLKNEGELNALENQSVEC